jgi:hypothetical protein
MEIKKRNQPQNKRKNRINGDPKQQDESIKSILNLSAFDNNISFTHQKKELNEKTLSEDNSFLNFLDFDFEKSISNRIKENENLGILFFNQNFNEYLENFLNGPKSLEGDVYSKLYWTDLGSFFINLLYSELGFKLPELIENINRTTSPKTINQITEIKKSSNKLENKNFDLNYDNIINIVTGSEADIITNQYNADALTIGNNIFFSQNKFDLTSPKGIGLLIHELVHVKQMKERGKAVSSEALAEKGYDTNFRLNTSLQSLVNSSDLENEAIEQEEKIISYMNYLQQSPFEDTNNNLGTSSTSINVAKNPFFSNSFPSYYNTFSYPFTTILHDILTNLNLSENIVNNVSNKQYIIHNKELINDNFIKSSVDPFVTNSNLFKAHNTNDEYFSFLGQNTTNHDNSKTSTYSPAPILFASRDRTVNSLSTISDSIPNNTMTNNSQIQSNISSEANPINNIPNIDIEYLADKVYNIFQNKIQIQKMRRGIS